MCIKASSGLHTSRNMFEPTTGLPAVSKLTEAAGLSFPPSNTATLTQSPLIVAGDDQGGQLKLVCGLRVFDDEQ